MSHSFARSEKAGVWESLRPFSEALPCPLMDFIGPKGERRNCVYLNAQLCGPLKCCSVFLPQSLCLHSHQKTKTFDPLCLLHLIAIFGLHRFSQFNNFPVKWGCFSLDLPLAFLAGFLCCSGGNLHLKTPFFSATLQWERLLKWHRHNRFESFCFLLPACYN